MGISGGVSSKMQVKSCVEHWVWNSGSERRMENSESGAEDGTQTVDCSKGVSASGRTFTTEKNGKKRRHRLSSCCCLQHKQKKGTKGSQIMMVLSFMHHSLTLVSGHHDGKCLSLLLLAHTHTTTRGRVRRQCSTSLVLQLALPASPAQHNSQ